MRLWGLRQDSDIVPLRPGLVFRCRVRFTNLSPAEIGLLLRAVLLANEPGAPGYGNWYWPHPGVIGCPLAP